MNRYTLNIRGREYQAEIKEITPEQATVMVDETEYVVKLVDIIRRGATTTVARRPEREKIASVPVASGPSPIPAGQHGNVRAPLPGLVQEVKVCEGATVRAGDPLVILEAMKMENMIQAPHDGTVRKVFVRQGDSVGDGDPLFELSRPEMTTL